MAVDFKTIQKRAEELVKNDQARVALFDAMREMFQMEWAGQPKADWVRKVISPDAYDAAMGILRLMMAAEPQITVASPETTTEDVVRDDVTERALRAVLRAAARAQEVDPVHDAALSAVLFGEVVLRVGNSADVAALAPKATRALMETRARRVPFTIECLNPGGVFTASDAFGLRRVVIVEETTTGAVREAWGTAARDLDGDDDDQVELYDYWDREWRCVWVKDAPTPLIREKHELPFIPIVRRVVQGTTLWTRQDGEQVWPLLYAMYKSGLWNAQNIALTMVYSLAYAMGSVPFLALEKESQNQPDPDIDWTRPGVNVRLLKGQKLTRVVMDAVPQEMLQVLQLVEGKTPEMLIPKVVFGQAPGASMSYSAINLLSQGGRLPLVPIQERLGEALAATLEIVLRWVIEEGKPVELWESGTLATLDPERLDPDRLWVEVEISPDVPMDRMQTLALVNQAVASELISKRTGRQWLHVTDDTAETEQILLERYISRMADAYAQAVAQESDLPAALGEEEGGMTPEEAVPELGEGPLFNAAQGGLPSVMVEPPTVEPQMPGAPGGLIGPEEL